MSGSLQSWRAVPSLSGSSVVTSVDPYILLCNRPYVVLEDKSKRCPRDGWDSVWS